MNVFKIALPQALDAVLHLADKKYPSATDAADAVRKACMENGVKIGRETTEDKCTVFWNERGGLIARVVPPSRMA